MKVVFDDTMMKNINQFLTSLGDKERSRLYVSAMKKAARPMVDTARDYAPFKTGRLFYSIDVIKKPGDDMALLFGIKTGGIYVGWRGRWIDRGWTPKRGPNKKDKRMAGYIKAYTRDANRPSEAKVGRKPGAWFIRKGYEFNEDNFIPIMNRELNTIIARQIRKYTKK
jgi:hypothetical protein